MTYIAPIGDPRRALLESRAARMRRAPAHALVARGPRAPAALDALGLWPFSSSDVAKSEGALPPAVAAWQSAVKARGNIVTRMPKGPNVGKLAERYIDASGTARYALASPEALEADGRGQAVLTADIAAGARVEQLEKGIRDVSSAIAAAPRNIAGAVLGIPPWAVTAIVLGAGALALKTVLPSLSVRRNPPRAEPGGRRRRRRSSRRR
jgi:hypothetical protein